MLLELFENLRDGAANTQEELNNQVKFKSDLSEIEIGITDFKSEDKKKKKCYYSFNLVENIIQLYRVYYFLLFEAKYKAKHGEISKY